MKRDKKSSKKGKSLKFECQHCGICCNSDKIIVTLLHVDILLLIKYVGTIEELLPYFAFYVSKNEVTALNPQMMVPPFETTRGLAYLGLNKRIDKCIFYHKQRCSIYSYRPLACRTFPFGLTTKDGKRIISVVNAKKIGCQGIGKGRQIMKPMLNELFDQTTTALTDFHQFVKEVNREQKLRGLLSLKEISALMLLYADKKINIPVYQEIELI